MLIRGVSAHIILGLNGGFTTGFSGGNAEPDLAKPGDNMHIARRFTISGKDPYESIAFRTATSEIRNPDGSVVFAAEGVEVPAEWSQVACDILAQKYLRKAGVPAILSAFEEPDVTDWLWRRTADADKLALVPKDERSGGE